MAMCNRTLAQFDEVFGSPCGTWFAPGEPDDQPGCGHSNLLHQAEGTCLGCQMEYVIGVYVSAGHALAKMMGPVIAMMKQALSVTDFLKSCAGCDMPGGQHRFSCSVHGYTQGRRDVWIGEKPE